MLEYAPVCYGMPEYAQVKTKMYFFLYLIENRQNIINLSKKGS